MTVDILRNDRNAPQAGTATAAPAPGAGTNLTPRRDERPYTTLGKDTEFEGTLKFREGLRIEGKFNGDIASEGNLIIGDTGEVTAEIVVGSIIVEGKITGNIVASDLVELRSTAQLRGDITASRLKIEEGVVFIGKSDVQPNNNRKGAQKGGGKPEEHKQNPNQQEKKEAQQVK